MAEKVTAECVSADSRPTETVSAKTMSRGIDLSEDEPKNARSDNSANST
jgi:hypothetical protein